jgi:hypothetical protein
MDETSTGLYPVAGFSVSGVEHSDPVVAEKRNYFLEPRNDLKDLICVIQHNNTSIVIKCSSIM